jgi:hypothetical protein
MSEYHDTFREVEGAANETIEVNSKSMASSRFVDPNRLGSRREWRYSDNPGKSGREVEIKNSLGDVARQAAGAMRTRSVFKDRDGADRRNDGCVPCDPYGYGDCSGPMTRRRGDD